MSRYIATYDISEDNRRVRVAHIVMRFGFRIQKSVFEVWLDSDELMEIRRLIGPLLDAEDQFEIIPIDVAPNRHRWRWSEPGEAYESVIVLGR